MMKRTTLGLAIPLLAFAFTLPATLEAQSLYVGVGPTIPTNDFGDYANTGVLGVAGVTVPVGEGGLSVLGEGFFGYNSWEASQEVDGDTQLFGFMGGLLWSPAEADEAGPYGFGQLGILWDKSNPEGGIAQGSDSNSKSGFGYGAGVGYGFPLGELNAWIEGRYMGASIDRGEVDETDQGSQTTGFFGIQAGLSFPLGGNGSM